MLEYRKYVGHVECSFVEMDPTGRYGRYNEVLGKGASKIVYRYWNQSQALGDFDRRVPLLWQLSHTEDACVQWFNL